MGGRDGGYSGRGESGYGGSRGDGGYGGGRDSNYSRDLDRGPSGYRGSRYDTHVLSTDDYIRSYCSLSTKVCLEIFG